ncbi:Crp/Fnr family transcriptional regulator [Hyphomonas pacifica]|uniref:Crp/Fnr family transcriptional regulator n=1 Tax=Hyphomonas pacifica TaxID=1280941 RepID=UPI000DD3FC39|nr:Crp/Fnr family transcriptional regulator [Hyphomonas pacifica]
MQVFRNRLSQYVNLDDIIWSEFEKLQNHKKSYEAGDDLIRVGQNPKHVFLLTEGWAIRHRTLEDGRRQIVNFMLPGDVFDLQVLANLEADHGVTAVNRTVTMRIEVDDFVNMLKKSGPLASAFWWSAVQEESILREQIVRVGRRSARERIGHLLLELQRRLQAAIGSQEDVMPLPLTRTDLADALGLTPVHVSGTMSALRRAGLIEEGRGRVKILDAEKLARQSHFDMDYLHMRRLDLLNGGGGAVNGHVRQDGSSHKDFSASTIRPPRPRNS